MTSPTKPVDLTVRFERDAIHIAGRYLKFSRTLPQSPWTSVPYADKILGNSVIFILSIEFSNIFTFFRSLKKYLRF